MGRNITKDMAIQHKKSAIKQLNRVFEAFINNPECSYLKKADILAYWIETFSRYLLDEKKFDYKRIPSYKRGSVISANLGFNVGSEQGGLRYAIVIDNDNRQSSPVLTVVPLTSVKVSAAYERDVYLGNELYDKMKTKYDKLIEQKLADLEDTKKMNNVLEELSKNLDSPPTVEDLPKILSDAKLKIKQLTKETEMLNKYQKEIDKMKQGSIALMEQITTISKMRIYGPKNSSDLLYGISFSDGAMNKINDRLKELYIFSK